MSELRYPNESPDYRKARDELLKAEKALVEQVKAVAEKRRQLPQGGRLQEDYKFQWANDGMQWSILQVFKKQGDKIFHFWGTELQGNHVDTVWPYWNLMDFTPEGRPDRMTPRRTTDPSSWKNIFLITSETSPAARKTVGRMGSE